MPRFVEELTWCLLVMSLAAVLIYVTAAVEDGPRH